MDVLVDIDGYNYLFEIAVRLDGTVVITVAVGTDVTAAIGPTSTLGTATLQGFASSVDMSPPVLRQGQILTRHMI